MTQSLKERYETRQQRLAEGFLDYFKSGSDNIQKFTSTLQALTQLAGKYNMANLQAALKKAEGDFQNVVMAQQSGQPADQNKATAISQAVTFVQTMDSFLKTLKNITTQLPSIQRALKDPNSKDQTLDQVLGQDQQKFADMVQSQVQKAGGGFLKSIGRLFKGGGGQDAQAVMTKYGISSKLLADDVMHMTPTQLNTFSQESASMPTFQVSAPAPKPGEQQNPNQQNQQAQAGGTPPKNEEPSQTTAPTQQGGATTQGTQGTANIPTPRQPDQQDQQSPESQAPESGVHPKAFDYIKQNITRLPDAQKKEILALLQGNNGNANNGQIQGQRIINVGGSKQ